MPFRGEFLFLLFALPCLLRAQEIKYIDLTDIRQRTDLRHPPAPQSDCKEGTGCIGGGSGGGGVTDGAPDQRDPHAIGVYLLRVTPTDINPAEPFQVEFKVLNTGSAPIQLPVSLHLSDLQPSDESVAFNYFSLALVVRGEADTGKPSVNSLGFVELFGAPDHAQSMVILRPREWIRVSATVKLRTFPSEPVALRFRGEFWLRRNIFHPRAGGQFIETNNLYPNSTPTPFVAVRLLPHKDSLRVTLVPNETFVKVTAVDSVLNSEISAFNLNNETIEVGLKRLASTSITFAMGFEHELKAKQTDPPIQNPRLTLHLTATTVREALDAMCHADGRYTWSTDDTFVNVYPLKTISDASYLMNRKLTKLDLKELTDIQQGLLAIVNQLPPPREQVAIAQIGGDDAYPPEPWTTSYENLTVRQAINRLARHMGERGSWAFTGSADFRAFAFNNLGFLFDSYN